MTYAEKLKDPRWQKARLAVLNRDKWTCQYCGDTTNTLHVHHLKYVDNDPWETPAKYLTTLCEECHQKEESFDIKEALAVFTEMGLTKIELSRLGYLFSDFPQNNKLTKQDLKQIFLLGMYPDFIEVLRVAINNYRSQSENTF